MLASASYIASSVNLQLTFAYVTARLNGVPKSRKSS